MHMSFAEEQRSRVAEIGIRRFQKGDAAAFRRLNEEWITLFFVSSRRRSLCSPIRSQRFWTRAAGYSSRRPGNDASAAAH